MLAVFCSFTDSLISEPPMPKTFELVSWRNVFKRKLTNSFLKDNGMWCPTKRKEASIASELGYTRQMIKALFELMW